MFRKLFLVFSVFALLIGTQPKPVQASAAPAYFSPVGIVLAVGGVTATAVGAYYMIEGVVTRDLLGIMLGGTVVLVGLVILDEDGGNAVEFKPLTPTEARAIGVTENECLAYNKDHSLIKSIAQTIDAETREHVKQTGTTSPAERIHFAHSRWQKYQGRISELAYSTMTKISQNLAQQLVSQAQ